MIPELTQIGNTPVNEKINLKLKVIFNRCETQFSESYKKYDMIVIQMYAQFQCKLTKLVLHLSLEKCCMKTFGKYQLDHLGKRDCDY